MRFGALLASKRVPGCRYIDYDALKALLKQHGANAAALVNTRDADGDRLPLQQPPQKSYIFCHLQQPPALHRIPEAMHRQTAT